MEYTCEVLTSSSLSKASLSFLLLSNARSQTCCHLLTSKLTLGFLVSICVCDPEGYKLEAGKRFPVKIKLELGRQFPGFWNRIRFGLYLFLAKAESTSFLGSTARNTLFRWCPISMAGAFKYWKALSINVCLRQFWASYSCHFNENEVRCDPSLC